MSNNLFISFVIVLCVALSDALVLQVGRQLKRIDGSVTPYTGGRDVEINTQYIASWNDNNGMTVYQGESPDFLLDENFGGNTQFRVLMRFDRLAYYIPTTATVSEADLTLTFITWNSDADLGACFITKNWDPYQVVRFKSTGWRYNKYDTITAKAPVSWTTPGGWDDCDSRVGITFNVPQNGKYGNVTATIKLDPGLVQEWVTSGGVSNFGILLRSFRGNARVMTNSAVNMAQRPALRIVYETGASPPAVTYPMVYHNIPRSIIVDQTNGSDVTGTGQEEFPYATPRKALFEASPGDSVNLRSGHYGGGLRIDKPHITLQSAPGHWATVAAPLNDPIGAVNAITVRTEAHYGIIRNLEITGGYYYGIMFWTDWENYASNADSVNIALAAGDYVVDNVRIHGTGSSCVKMVMKVSNVTISNSELYDCGARLRLNGHGIEAVQTRSLTVQDCYIHNVAAAGVHLAGGGRDSIVQRNYISGAKFGVNVGFATDYEYMDHTYNPRLYEHLRARVVNNIIESIRMAGVNIWAALDTVVMHNTLWNVQEYAQSAILINCYKHIDAPGAPVRSSSNVTIFANILRKSATARMGPVVQIRENGLDTAKNSFLRMGYNLYSDAKEKHEGTFLWGHGVMIEDEREGLKFVGNISEWSKHCSMTLKQDYCDINSIEYTDPVLKLNFIPASCSPAVGMVPTSILSYAVQDDFHGAARGVRGALFDIGAVSSIEPFRTIRKPIPPIPSFFAGKPADDNVGTTVAYYDTYQWPFYYWLTRRCVDIIVDAIAGDDSQVFNYESNYSKPFKTVQTAVIRANQCDRILLRGGQMHVGPVGIYRPNVTIMTVPGDAERATLKCNAIGAKNCIMTGEGFYDGAAELTLLNFNILMTNSHPVSNCIMLNEGYGGGTSPYWKFYVENSGRQHYSRGRTLIKDMEISGCGNIGVKLSTFVTGVQLENVFIHNVGSTGIEMRNGNDVIVRHCTLDNIGGSGIIMGGGSRGNVVESTVIKNFGMRGILIGSDSTEPQYMDVDFATKVIGGTWHDATEILIRNNIIAHGQGAGIGLYSAKDVSVVHNTIFDVGQSTQGAIIFSLSPKQLNESHEVLLSNTGVLIKNNIVFIAAGNNNFPLLELRIMQGSLKNTPPPHLLPTGTDASQCPAAATPRLTPALRGYTPPSNMAAASAEVVEDSPQSSTRRHLEEALDFAVKALNDPGQQGRNLDGSCPDFPDTNPWHMDVRNLPVHANSDSIKTLIRGGGYLHADFGGGVTKDGNFIPYGIPFRVVNSDPASIGAAPKQAMVPLKIAPTGYPEECDYPLMYPFPSDAPVEGAYQDCIDATCPGDRHVLIIDNSTCTLYETWRSFSPAVTGGVWTADIAVKFDLTKNKLRPLGYTSSDAAGLPVHTGLAKFDELINKGEIKHAIRFTGPNSRAAYEFPATHYAPTGDTGPDSPWMGMRVRLKSSFNCGSLKRAASVFCVALQKYGGIFADNGGPWYFSGEGTPAWTPYLSELQDISQIPVSEMEILDNGCLCLTSECWIADCGNGTMSDGLQVYSSVDKGNKKGFAPSILEVDNNVYFRGDNEDGSPHFTRFVDRRAGKDLGSGFDGVLDGGLKDWKKYSLFKGSFEKNPYINYLTYAVSPKSIATYKVPPLLDLVPTDFFGRAVSVKNGLVTAGALFSTSGCPVDASQVYRIGDGKCDSSLGSGSGALNLNIEECLWDGGDCCETSCQANTDDRVLKLCGRGRGYQCIDPSFKQGVLTR